MEVLERGVCPVDRKEGVELPEADRKRDPYREPRYHEARHEAHQPAGAECTQYQEQHTRHRCEDGQRLGAVPKHDMAQDRDEGCRRSGDIESRGAEDCRGEAGKSGGIESGDGADADRNGKRDGQRQRDDADYQTGRNVLTHIRQDEA